MNAQSRLLQMLTYKRPDGSQAEEQFVHKFIECYPHKKYGPMENIVIVIPGDDETLFSCHTDTVHREGGTQKVMWDSDMGYAYKSDGECLGADDTTGVWLMLEMIDAKVPGTYIFHRGEERGGIGSGWMSENMQDWLRKFKRAIAFDRKGETSVITEQMCGECCSEHFANSLCITLGPDWTPDNTGTFTDTANYIEFIAECTNVSVGYYDQHTKGEQQNVAFALELRQKLIELSWHLLPTVRIPKKEDPYESRLFTSFGSKWPKATPPGRPLLRHDLPTTLAEAMSSNDEDIENLIYDDPATAVDILIEALELLRYVDFEDVEVTPADPPYNPMHDPLN
jgi:hypothetical protein